MAVDLPCSAFRKALTSGLFSSESWILSSSVIISFKSHFIKIIKNHSIRNCEMCYKKTCHFDPGSQSVSWHLSLEAFCL